MLRHRPDDVKSPPQHLRSVDDVGVGRFLGLFSKERWLRGPGSVTGKDSKIEADCIKAEDGSVTCDTKVVNPASDTKARTYYNPFND